MTTMLVDKVMGKLNNYFSELKETQEEKERLEKEEQLFEYKLKNDLIKKSKSTQFIETTKLLKQYMADFTSNTSVSLRQATVAVVTSETGEVWLASSKNPAALHYNYKNGLNLPKLLKAAVAEGQKLHIFMTSREIDVEELQQELIEMEVYLNNQTRRSTQGEDKGYVYVVRHRITNNFYLSRKKGNVVSETQVLSVFFNNIVKIKNKQTTYCNTKLAQFVTECASDILNQVNFTVSVVGEYKNGDEAVQLMEEFAKANVFGKCLNRNID